MRASLRLGTYRSPSAGRPDCLGQLLLRPASIDLELFYAILEGALAALSISA
jgi:hypothetical protein